MVAAAVVVAEEIAGGDGVRRAVGGVRWDHVVAAVRSVRSRTGRETDTTTVVAGAVVAGCVGAGGGAGEGRGGADHDSSRNNRCVLVTTSLTIASV